MMSTGSAIAARLYRAHPSTVMVFIAWVAAAMVMHVSTVGLLIVLALGPWLFITREIARIEGAGRGVTAWGMRGMVLAAAALAAVLIFAASAVRFVGI